MLKWRYCTCTSHHDDGVGQAKPEVLLVVAVVFRSARMKDRSCFVGGRRCGVCGGVQVVWSLDRLEHEARMCLTGHVRLLRVRDVSNVLPRIMFEVTMYSKTLMNFITVHSGWHQPVHIVNMNKDARIVKNAPRPYHLPHSSYIP